MDFANFNVLLRVTEKTSPTENLNTDLDSGHKDINVMANFLLYSVIELGQVA